MSPASYLYAFQGFPSRLLFTGRLANGHQLLVGPMQSMVIALEFDEEGLLIAVQEQELEHVRDYTSLKDAVSWYFDSQNPIPSTIRIRRLAPDGRDGPLARSCRQHGFTISIDDYPLGLEDPEGYVAVDQDPGEYLAQREQWRTSGCYVLNWGGDELYIDGDGRVFST